MFNSRRVFLAVSLPLVICGGALTPSSDAQAASDRVQFITPKLWKGAYSTNTPDEPQQNPDSYEPSGQDVIASATKQSLPEYRDCFVTSSSSQ